MARRELHITPIRTIQGTLRVPGDKSISHRYMMLGAIARGRTRVAHLAPGADVAATIACMRRLGVHIDTNGAGTAEVRGAGRQGLAAPSQPLDAANSGTTMRLLSGIVAGHPFRSQIIGDESLSRRPMRRVIDPLTAMGASVQSQDGRAPLVIQGGHLHAITWTTPVPSAQIKSAVLLAGLHAEGKTTVNEAVATRDHSERALGAFGVEIGVADRSCSVVGGQELVAPADLLTVPGDPSSAAVWACTAAAFSQSAVELENVCLNPLRLGFVPALRRMGAKVEMTTTAEVAGESVGTIRVSHEANQATTIGGDEVPSLIDELPVLAARAALGGQLQVTGANELRVKESDRITALVTGFRALGVNAEELPDGFVIDGSKRPTGGRADAVGDHRLVMAFALVGLGATGPTLIDGAEAVGVSYPSFESDLSEIVR